MTWRNVVITDRAKLDLQLGYMVVRGEQITKVHIGEMATLMIESTEVSITAALLAELIKNKVKVVFCDDKRLPTSELVPYYGSHDVSAKIKQQIAWSEQIKGEVGTEIIRAKIKMQAGLLERFGLQGAELLRRYTDELQFKDLTNREGHAAKVYFNSLFGMDFTRAGSGNINAALNYAYTVLLAACSREITANGYLTGLGLIHDNVFNYFNLGSDLMEPLRILVDRMVYGMWEEGKLESFSVEVKHELLSFLQKEVFVDNKKMYFNYAVKQYCKSVFDALNEKDISLIKWVDFVD